jgi:hypothetical protein
MSTIASAHLTRLSCALWGHVVNNEVFKQASGNRRQCRCGSAYLPEDGTLTHVRHTLSCFLRHHTYTYVNPPAARHGNNG